MHTLYDVEAQVPAFVHITTARTHDIKAMPEIPYEAGAHYIFDRAYNDYNSLYTINRIGAFFVLSQIQRQNESSDLDKTAA